MKTSLILETPNFFFTAKEKQQVASNWFMPLALREKLLIKTLSYTGSELTQAIVDGYFLENPLDKNSAFVITWLSMPEACFSKKAEIIRISLRQSKQKSNLMRYAVIKLLKDSSDELQ